MSLYQPLFEHHFPFEIKRMMPNFYDVKFRFICILFDDEPIVQVMKKIILFYSILTSFTRL